MTTTTGGMTTRHDNGDARHDGGDGRHDDGRLEDIEGQHNDERHICPLQLEVIRRVVMLWTNPGEVVFSPFMGIGSEGHVAVGGATRAGKRLVAPRKFIGAELKASYFKQAVANLRAAEFVRQPDLFDMGGA